MEETCHGCNKNWSTLYKASINFSVLKWQVNILKVKNLPNNKNYNERYYENLRFSQSWKDSWSAGY